MAWFLVLQNHPEIQRILVKEEEEACKLHQPLVRYVCYCDLFIEFQ